MKTLLLSSIALVGMAVGATAAPSVVSPPAMQPTQSLVIPVAESSLPNSGKVDEVIDTGNYTYLHAMKDGVGTWLAIPKRAVEVGAKIHYRDGQVMKNFHSDSLNRTFEEVRFLGNIEVEGEAASASATEHPAVATLPPGHAPVPGMSGGQQELPNAGRVAETIAAGKYTYLRVEDEGKETWLAMPKRDVSVGALVRYGDGQSMKDFHSPSLDRTFDEVLFVAGVEVEE